MLLSINENKIAELLKSSPSGYVVSTSDVPIATENFRPTYPTTSEVSGLVYTVPALATEAREYLASVRRKIEESSIPLKSVDDLEKEIDEMRGRSR